MLFILDEAVVFLQRHVELTLERARLAANILRKLEYYDGVLFLTIKLIHQFDDAILNRIHLTMKYERLEKAARETVITYFLQSFTGGEASSNVSIKYVRCFASVSLNGRHLSHTP